MKRRTIMIARALLILVLFTVHTPLTLAQGQQQGVIPVGPAPADSDGLVIVFNFESACQSIEMRIVDAPPDREGEHTCATEPNPSFKPGVGDGIYGIFTVHNTSNHPIVMKAIRLAGRGPGAQADNWDAPGADWPADTDITIEPDGYYEYARQQYFNGATGDYFAEPVFQDTQGGWHGISPFPRIWFDLIDPSLPSPPNSEPDQRPEGEIAFGRDGNIFILDLASGETRQITRDGSLDSNVRYSDMAWSPDGQMLAYDFGEIYRQIYTMRPDGTDQAPVPHAEGDSPVYGPDGTLYYISDNNFVRYNPGGAPTVLYRGDDTGHCYLSRPSVTSDGRFIINESCNYGMRGIIFGQLSSSGDAVPQEIGGNLTCNHTGRWSPDGSTLAYVYQECGTGTIARDLYVADYPVDTANPRFLYSGELISGLDWSPDGMWIVFGQRGETDPALTGLWAIPSAGGDAVQLTTGEDYGSAWRPSAVPIEPTAPPQPTPTLTPTTTPTLTPSPTLAPAPAPAQLEIVSFGTEMDTARSEISDERLYVEFLPMDDLQLYRTYELKVFVRNSGDSPLSGHYKARITALDAQGKAVDIPMTYDSAADGLRAMREMAPGRPNLFSIGPLNFFSLVPNGSLLLEITPTSGGATASLSLPLQVGDNDNPGGIDDCLVGYALLALKPLADELGEAAAVLLEPLAEAYLECSRGDVGCAARATAEWVLENWPKLFNLKSEWAAGVGLKIPVKLYSALKDSFDIAFEQEKNYENLGNKGCRRLGSWISAITNARNGIGERISSLFSQSPVYPLLVDSQGRRSGFLPDGVQVEEIPGTDIYVMEEERLITVNIDEPLTAQVYGYADGSMTLTLDTPSSTSTLLYPDVPVVAGMEASIAPIQVPSAPPSEQSAAPAPPLLIEDRADGEVTRKVEPQVAVPAPPAGTEETVRDETAPAPGASQVPPTQETGSVAFWLAASAGAVVLVILLLLVRLVRSRKS